MASAPNILPTRPRKPRVRAFVGSFAAAQAVALLGSAVIASADPRLARPRDYGYTRVSLCVVTHWSTDYRRIHTSHPSEDNSGNQTVFVDGGVTVYGNPMLFTYLRYNAEYDGTP